MNLRRLSSAQIVERLTPEQMYEVSLAYGELTQIVKRAVEGYARHPKVFKGEEK